MSSPSRILVIGALLLDAAALAGGELPRVPEGFRVSLFAREPSVRNPTALAFDARGRLFVAQGPQFRHPAPDTLGDSIRLITDDDGDGAADEVRTFAEGFNSIHAMAWRGGDLWVANSPDLTLVRDLDGDDRADEHVLVFTDLGNLEHGLHGLTFAPDGWLWMSKGNSKGLTRTDRLAPRPFRELWGVASPPGAPDFPAPRVFSASDYRRSYHPPADDWGREGGILRCRGIGDDLEIVARGLRNPWDMACDGGFHWIGTDNDQNGGDKIFMPFFGAHFGWGHAWSAEWKPGPNAPTSPASGPFFDGSGTGVVWTGPSSFPMPYRDVFLIADWLRGMILVMRPEWDGALLRHAGDTLEVFASADGALFRPTDVELGPDGALWVLGWGAGYGAEWADGEQTNEGRVFRIEPAVDTRPVDRTTRGPPVRRSGLDSLIEELGSAVAARRITAQDELLRRGSSTVAPLLERLRRGATTPLVETWLTWTLGRLDPESGAIDAALAQRVIDSELALDAREQALRALAERCRDRGDARAPAVVDAALASAEPRLRFHAVEAVRRSEDPGRVGALLELASTESDPLVFEAAWKALGALVAEDELRSWLADGRAGVRRAALYALLEASAMTRPDVERLAADPERSVADLAASWLRAESGFERNVVSIDPPGGAFDEAIAVVLRPVGGAGTIRWTLDGSPPNGRSQTYSQPIRLSRSATLRAARFDDEARVGPVASADFVLQSPEEVEATRIVRSARIASGLPCVERSRGFDVGRPAYTDRGYVLTEVPPELVGSTRIVLPNADSGSRGGEYLRFEALDAVDVFVAHDRRIGSPPSWLASSPGAFERTDLEVVTNDARFRVFRRRFPAGEVSLGGNTVDGVDGGKSHYLVAVRPAPLEDTGLVATLDAAHAALEAADPQRGARLFFGRAACDRCHRVGALGQEFAPDLSAVGARASVEEILLSIVEPSARIVEGFRSHVVVSRDGRVVSGIVVEETAGSLRLVPADGRAVRVEKSDILRRESVETSAMPDFSRLLRPEQIADLAAWLAKRRASAEAASQAEAARGGSAGAGGEAATASARRVSFEPAEGELHVLIDGERVATWVHSDPRIPRPFLAHVRHRGVAVTRPHPPGPDDPSDHADMHPGVWLAFGDIDGEDTWRLRAPVVHDAFVEVPKGGVGAGSFRVRQRYLTSDRSRTICVELCRLTFRPRNDGFLVLWESELIAGERRFVLGDQEEMGLGVRVASPLREKGGDGRIRASTGLETARATWGQAADWCDYSGTVDGRVAGVTVLASPRNPRPSWWHNRDYGVFVANLFGRAAMRQGPPSRIEVPAGGTLRLAYGVRVHVGPPGSYRPELEWSAYRELESARSP